ncbi:MAG: YidC/Oxa1 family membrane protein insertase [Coriobacteriales bacterium]|nr:YidC/Oxa1 family membrane protein insertase [Coriobacteriales bacterium]
MWEAFQQGIFYVIDWFYGIAHDWGLAIILITILFRILIYPITRKQFKSTHEMQKLQPRLAEIKEKYAGDQARIQEETMKIYQETKFNPLSGCLPMILQMPIFIALYWVLRELPTYIQNSTHSESALPATFYGLIPDLSVSPGSVFSSQGILAVVPYAILVLLFGVSMLIPLLLNKNRERQTLIMTGVMSIVMVWFGWTSPAGVLLYWDASSLLGAAQQTMSRKLMEKKDQEREEAVEVKPVKVEVERKTKKARPKKTK